MRYEARMTAYDVMDTVFVTVSVYSQEDVATGSTELAASSSTTVQGTGEADPVEWTRDALIALLETL